MKIIVGLGNPGSRYQETRHNIGWMILDAVASRLRTEFQPGKGDYYAAEGSWRGRKLVLVKPTTFMNNSGLAAKQVLRHYRAKQDEMMVVVDEVQFPVGRIKMSPGGSSGGHNGIESLIWHIDGGDFPRLRCGVGNDFERGDMADYVLGKFSSDEAESVNDMIERGKEALLGWVVDGTAKTMNRVNVKAKDKKNDGGNQNEMSDSNTNI